jgi:hypothetical protein
MELEKIENRSFGPGERVELKTLPIPDAYKVFLKVGTDPEVQKLRRKVEGGNKMKHVPALYLATAMALQSLTKQELEALKLRIAMK